MVSLELVRGEDVVLSSCAGEIECALSGVVVNSKYGVRSHPDGLQFADLSFGAGPSFVHDKVSGAVLDGGGAALGDVLVLAVTVGYIDRGKQKTCIT